MNCLKFLKKSLEERKEFVKTNKHCENCLSKGDLLESCTSNFNCSIKVTARKSITRF